MPANEYNQNDFESLSVDDNGDLTFGSDGDYNIRYDATNDELQFRKGTTVVSTIDNVPRWSWKATGEAEFFDSVRIRDDLRMNGNKVTGVNVVAKDVQDVRNISSPQEGWYADHDGSGTNTEGLARFDGTNWISQVDGSTIS